MKKLFYYMLYIVLIFSVIFLNIFVSVSKSIKKDTINSYIEEKFFNNFIYDDYGNKTEIFNTTLKLTTLDEYYVIKLIEHETVNDILTDIVNSIYDYNLTGDKKYIYSKEQIIIIVENNIDKVMKDIGYNLTPSKRKAAINYTYENTNYIINTIYSTDIGDYKHD